MIRFLIITGFIFTFSLTAQENKETVKDAETKPAEEKKKIPVKITADHMKYDDTGFIVYFTGNVHVDDGQMKVDSDLMTVKLDKNRDPELIICEKNVVIRKEDTTSTSDRAEYFLPEEKVVLTGKPKVVKISPKGEKQTMTGSKIIFYRNSNVIESQGVGMEFPGGGSDAKKSDKPKEEKK